MHNTVSLAVLLFLVPFWPFNSNQLQDVNCNFCSSFFSSALSFAHFTSWIFLFKSIFIIILLEFIELLDFFLLILSWDLVLPSFHSIIVRRARFVSVYVLDVYLLPSWICLGVNSPRKICITLWPLNLFRVRILSVLYMNCRRVLIITWVVPHAGFCLRQPPILKWDCS